jgi:hypothetical protein
MIYFYFQNTLTLPIVKQAINCFIGLLSVTFIKIEKLFTNHQNVNL